jgi:hypothetical protein
MTYVYIYIYIFIYLYLRVYIYIYIYIYIYMCVCVCVCSCWSLLYPFFEWVEEIIYLSRAFANFTTSQLHNMKQEAKETRQILRTSMQRNRIYSHQVNKSFPRTSRVLVTEIGFNTITVHIPFLWGNTFIDTKFSSSNSGFSPSLSTRRSLMR